MRYFILLFLTVILTVQSTIAQNYKYFSYGGAGDEEFRNFIQTPDGGYLGVGYVQATGGYVHGSAANKDALVVKMDVNGDILWAKAYGGDFIEEFYDVAFYQGYYYCTGFTSSWSMSGGTTNTDIFLVKIDLSGSVIWAKNYGEPTVSTRFNDQAFNIIPTNNNTGVLLVGSSGANNATDQNIIALRILPDGTTGFGKSYDLLPGSGQSGDFGRWPVAVTNNEYVIAGNIWSGGGNRDPVLLRINNSGNQVWARQITVGSPTNFEDVMETPVYDQAKDRLFTGGLYTVNGTTDFDPLVYRDIRQSTGLPIGTTSKARAFSTGATDTSRGYLYKKKDATLGYYMTMQSTVADPLFNSDAVIFSLDTALNIQWQRQFGGLKHDYLRKVMTGCNNNDVIGMGATRSSAGANGLDLFIGRLTSSGGFDISTPACILNSTFAPTTPNCDNTNLTGIVVADLTSGWFGSITNMVAPIDVKPYLQLRMTECNIVSSLLSVAPPEFMEVKNTAILSIEPDASLGTIPVKFELDPANDLPILNTSFKIFDRNDFIYYETTEIDKLLGEITLQRDSDIPVGKYYFWEYKSMLKNGTIDTQVGTFSVE
jgi:hypothetical protein